MYLPPQFAEPRADEARRIIRAHPLGMLVTHGAAGLDASHLPFLFDTGADAGPRGTLLAHVGRANPVWREASQPVPWKMGDAPADFIAEELGHIVGLEIRIDQLEAKRKLNQHQETRDREGAIRGLEECGHAALARAMRSTMPSDA